MAYLHDGHAAYPMRLGHEWCGIVAAVGPAADERWLGRRVAGPRWWELPDAVDDVAGAMVEPGGNALRAVWSADLQPGDRVLVLGPGTIAAADLPRLVFDVVIDASNAAALPALALELVEPGKRVVYIGIAGAPSMIDTRTLLLKDVTAVGVLSASPALAATVSAYAEGSVDPRPLVAATVGLNEVGAVLAGDRPAGAGDGPKIHVDPSQ
jgi:threonine dehydrogenase-like Zn-dependent dehydrogenase